MSSPLAHVPHMSVSSVKARKRQEALAYADSQKGITRCLWCRWRYRGEVGRGRELFRLHVTHAHGERA